MAITLIQKHKDLFIKLMSFSSAAAKIDENCVYQECNPEARELLPGLIEGNALPGSGLFNVEKIKKFYDMVVNEGKSGVIMMEHFSNADLPAFLYFLHNLGEDWAKDMESRIVAIAGMKLNESADGVRAFAESFTRVVIYPTRSLAALAEKGVDPAIIEEEEKRARKINFAAMRAMDGCKKRGQIILVFPSGTRYRPGKPETKRGLRELDSYLRIFDICLPIAINNPFLVINPDTPDDMLSDLVIPSVLKMTACDIIECKKFRNETLAKIPADCEDPKQVTVDTLMAVMEEMHEKVENEK